MKAALSAELRRLEELGVTVLWRDLHRQDGHNVAVRMIHFVDDGTWEIWLNPGLPDREYHLGIDQLWRYAASGEINGPWRVRLAADIGRPTLGQVILTNEEPELSPADRRDG